MMAALLDRKAAWNRSMTAAFATGFGVWIVILPSMPGVPDRENVAEDGLGRLRRRHVDEVERDAVGDIFGRPADRAGRRLADEAAGTLDHR
jgi:hypothetical protein